VAVLGASPGILVGVALGEAASAAFEPIIEPARQDAWRKNQNAILSAGLMARLAARGGVSLPTARTANTSHGLTTDKTDALVYLEQTMPGFGQVRDLLNRKVIGDPEVAEALTRLGFPADWQTRLAVLFAALLEPGQLAAAIHRGLIPDPGGLLKGQQPAPPFKVEAYPVYPVNALTEAEGWGYDRDRLGVLVGLQGLPMGTHEAAQAYFRGIIEHGDYIRAFNESNSRNEWAEAVLGYSRQIPTARDFLENALRGYRTLDEAVAGAALHGMSEPHATMIYQNQGRPMTPRLITQALARGGTFKPEPGEITDPYRAAIVEGNLKPAYYDLAYANRYNLPSAFFIRLLISQGKLTVAEGADLFKQMGWPPDLADQIAAALAPGGTTAEDPWLKKAEQQLWTATHKAYVKDDSIDLATAEANLSVLGIDTGTAAAIGQLWQQEKNLGALPRGGVG
jgi:hypothetical protein